MSLKVEYCRYFDHNFVINTNEVRPTEQRTTKMSAATISYVMKIMLNYPFSLLKQKAAKKIY